MKRVRTEEFIKQLEEKLGNYPEADTGSYSAECYPYDSLRAPVSFGGITLKNRVIQECAQNALEAAAGGAGLVISPVSYDRSLEAMSGWRALQTEARTQGAYVFAELIAEQDRSSPLSAFMESGAMLKELTDFADEIVFQQWDGVYFVDRMSDRFGLKLLRRLRAVLGQFMPIIYRISITGSGSRSIADTLDYMAELADAGADMFAVDMGFEAWMNSMSMPAGCFTDISKFVREYFAAVGISVPVAAVGRLEYPDTAEKALKSGCCDAVVLENAEAEWCVKAFSGKTETIKNQYSAGISYESVSKAAKAKKLAVIGSGAEALNFALFAAQRGHSVEILEKQTAIGGRLGVESALHEMYEARDYAERLKNAVSECENIKIRTSCLIPTDVINHGSFDAVIDAVDLSPVSSLNIRGWGEIPAVSINEIMAAPERSADKRRITILGNDDLALICARKLKLEHKNLKINVISSADSGDARLMHYLCRSGVRVLFNAEASKIVSGSVYADIKGEKEDVKSLRTELLVMALNNKDAVAMIGKIPAETEYHSLMLCGSIAEAEVTAYKLAITL